MINPRRIYVGIAGLVAAAALTAVGVSYMHQPTISIAPVARTLSMPHPDGECLAINEPNGYVVHVQYCNGDFGIREFVPGTKTLRKQVIWYKDGDRQRFYAEYAPDGKQELTGFELRDNGSKLWDAHRDDQGEVVKTSYWYNDAVFSVEKRAPGAEIADMTYYHPNGNRWAHVVGEYGLKLSLVVHRTSTGHSQEVKTVGGEFKVIEKVSGVYSGL